MSEKSNISVNSKTERYSKRELIGSGAFKSVYKAYDSEEGREVAWNEVRITNVKKQARERILSEISILGQLQHKRIMSIYDSWESEDGKFLIFITEIMSSGTLKDFLGNAKKIKLRSVKKWCRQILEGLDYLHKIDPHPIIHRDIKCDNIFMNGNRSEVKIGDLGLSISMKDKTFAVSVIGTPEFMAPELYDEHYTEKVDIYAFGMCVLEMVTGDYPYCECGNPAQVYKRVIQGIKPMALENIQDELTKEFINACLATSAERPSAEMLLKHPFFTSIRNDDVTLYIGDDDEDDELMCIKKNSTHDVEKRKTTSLPREDANYTRVVVEEISPDSDTVVMKVFLNLEGTYKQIKFPYNKIEDTAEAVAAEMARSLNLPSQHRKKIAFGIAKTLERIENGKMSNDDLNPSTKEDVTFDEDTISERSNGSDDQFESETPIHDIKRPNSAVGIHSKISDQLYNNEQIGNIDVDSVASAPENLEFVNLDLGNAAPIYSTQDRDVACIDLNIISFRVCRKPFSIDERAIEFVNQEIFDDFHVIALQDVKLTNLDIIESIKCRRNLTSYIYDNSMIQDESVAFLVDATAFDNVQKIHRPFQLGGKFLEILCERGRQRYHFINIQLSSNNENATRLFQQIMENQSMLINNVGEQETYFLVGDLSGVDDSAKTLLTQYGWEWMSDMNNLSEVVLQQKSSLHDHIKSRGSYKTITMEPFGRISDGSAFVRLGEGTQILDKVEPLLSESISSVSSYSDFDKILEEIPVQNAANTSTILNQSSSSPPHHSTQQPKLPMQSHSNQTSPNSNDQINEQIQQIEQKYNMEIQKLEAKIATLLKEKDLEIASLYGRQRTSSQPQFSAFSSLNQQNIAINQWNTIPNDRNVKIPYPSQEKEKRMDHLTQNRNTIQPPIRNCWNTSQNELKEQNNGSLVADATVVKDAKEEPKGSLEELVKNIKEYLMPEVRFPK